MVIGLLLRLHRFGQPFLGDELSSLYIVKGNDLAGTISAIASDKEISPPLYFVLGWFATKLGSAPELLRLPSMIAGTLSIPLVYLVGARAVSRTAGLLAATVMTLMPFMIFYSGDGRTYGLAIGLVLGSTLAMLAGIRTGRARWWVAYGVLTALCMYTHYTAAFVLGAQLLWMLWAHPESRRAAILANVGAVIVFAPWIPSMLADFDSPTVKILSALQGDGFDIKRLAVESWAFGYPYVLPKQVPGHAALYMTVIALIAAVAVVGAQIARGGHERLFRRTPPKGALLVFAIAIATPLAEALILVTTGNDLFGARNLNMSSAGLALAIGTLLAATGPRWGALLAVIVLAGFTIGAARTLREDSGPIRFDLAADFIASDAEPGDVVVDALSAAVTPVPLTPLEIYLDDPDPDLALFLPTGDPPFLPFGSEPLPASPLLRDALEEAAGHRLFLVAPDLIITSAEPGQQARITDLGLAQTRLKFTDLEAARIRLRLPAGARIVDRETFDALAAVNVYVIDPGPAEGARTG